jgi:hypothetical protein
VQLQEELSRLNAPVHERPPAASFEYAPLPPGFSLPTLALDELLGRLGVKLFFGDHTYVQYLAWGEIAGLFSAMERVGALTAAEASAQTPLNERGADALLGVLCGLGLAARSSAGLYALTRAGRDYLLRESPFFIGDQIRMHANEIPRAYRAGGDGSFHRLRLRLLGRLPAFRFGSPMRLRNQHARNLPSCAAAVRTGEFAAVRCLIDVAGGSGTFSIPLALEYPTMRIALAELPGALPNIRPFIARHGLQDRIELLGLDVLARPWQLPECDGIFMGNFLHGFGDDTCIGICREAFACLSSRGRIWVHEMLWNENKDGPLITALSHADMRSGGEGRQRTARELMAILHSAGFVDPYLVPTAGAFALIAGYKR